MRWPSEEPYDRTRQDVASHRAPTAAARRSHITAAATQIDTIQLQRCPYKESNSNAPSTIGGLATLLRAHVWYAAPLSSGSCAIPARIPGDLCTEFMPSRRADYRLLRNNSFTVKRDDVMPGCEICRLLTLAQQQIGNIASTNIHGNMKRSDTRRIGSVRTRTPF